LKARYYSSSNGKFLSVDPSSLSVQPEDPRTWNLFTYVLNNPLKFVDPNGKWSEPAHNQIIDTAYRSVLTEEERDYLKYRSKVIDDDQSLEGSYKHGMSYPGQDPIAATMEALLYIDRELREAVHQQILAERLELVEPGKNYLMALYHFGNALHTATDLKSPQHEGGQVWRGKGNPASWVHVVAEAIGAPIFHLDNFAEAVYEAMVLRGRYQLMLREERKKRKEEEEKRRREAEREK
jgi:hypothetical protein